jgi:4-aminobutyrate aminotransferase-like enzyme
MYDLPLADLADEAELRRLETEYCSYGDTVHYLPEPKFFAGCDGSFMYDAEGRSFLDLQMWYSAVNFGYRNPRLNAVAHRQLDVLPQVASQYLHREKVELAATIAAPWAPRRSPRPTAIAAATATSASALSSSSSRTTSAAPKA